MPAARRSSMGRWLAAWLVIIIATVALVLVAERTGHGRSIVSSVQGFLLTYAGVFALIALTAAVGVGLLATDRIVMRPGHRVVAQAVHRGVSLAALAALAAHVVLEIVAHRSHAIDAVVPFLARRRPLYIGLGTVSWDLFVLIVISGFARGRFAGRWPWAWRSIHAIAYLAWPLAIAHGLLAGRTARPYVDWSYGACLAAVALALAVRRAATLRASDEKAPQPVPDRLSVPTEGLMPGTRVAVAPLGSAPLGPAGPPRRALPAGQAGAAGPARTAEVSRITRPGQVLSADLTDPGSWRSPREWQSPPEHPAADEYPVTGGYAAGDFAAGRYPDAGRHPDASQEWPASPDWPASPGWKADPDEYDR